ncbi:MAG: tail fiber domain-containing protein, partial [Armatimonadia bacterium]
MARYSAVNRRAEAAAAQPFKPYSSDPNAFVAPLTGAQQAGIQNIGSAQNIAQPYYQMGTGLTLAGARGVGPLTQGQIGYYENPYTQAVAGTTFDALRQQQQQEMQGATANAIRSGAFGGDRSGLVAANLARQQQLGTAQAMAPIYERGYAQALQTAQGQQGVQAQDLQRQLAAGQQLAGLGTGASQTALQAGQALLGAGTAEQQTQQAGLSALYNQFLQERGYPFQVAQFLANIAMGTGALSGSTTTTQQPVPFFSDEREKTNIQPLGKGLYAYDYIDDVEAAERGERPMPPKRVGPMAQDIEERAPGLVGEVGGHKVVKGLAPESMGGAVVDLMPGEYRSGYAPGGLVGSDDIRAILEAQKQAFAPFAQAGLYGGNPQQGGVGKPGYVPGGMLPTPKLMTAGPAPRMPESTVSQAMNTASQFGLKPSSLYDMGRKGLGTVADLLKERGPSIDETSATQGTPDVGAP